MIVTESVCKHANNIARYTDTRRVPQYKSSFSPYQHFMNDCVLIKATQRLACFSGAKQNESHGCSVSDVSLADRARLVGKSDTRSENVFISLLPPTVAVVGAYRRPTTEI